MKAKKVYESITDIFKPKELDEKGWKIINTLKKMLDIVNDSNYPKYMDGDLKGYTQDINKVGKIYAMSHILPVEGSFFWIHADLSSWSDGADPSKVLNSLKEHIDDILYELGFSEE